MIDERKRATKYSVVVRSINTRDFMTADVTLLPWNVLSRIGGNLLKTMKSVSAVYYDITSKPPATVEFE
jgi:GMP synthase (glutamine-hydrolysing)